MLTAADGTEIARSRPYYPLLITTRRLFKFFFRIILLIE